MSTANIILKFHVEAATALRGLSIAARTATKAFEFLRDEVAECYYATRSGEWPDEFSLLNRYMRTGRKPRWFSGEMK